MTNLVNEELVNINVFACRIIPRQDLGQFPGKFDLENWTILINNELISEPTIDSKKMAFILEVIYHEARHAEQWYRMARMLAGRGKTAEQIFMEMGVPMFAAQGAVENPLKPLKEEDKKTLSIPEIKQKEKEVEEAQDWYNSIYGYNKPHRDKVLIEQEEILDKYKQAADNLAAKIEELKPLDEAFDQAEEE